MHRAGSIIDSHLASSMVALVLDQLIGREDCRMHCINSNNSRFSEQSISSRQDLNDTLLTDVVR